MIRANLLDDDGTDSTTGGSSLPGIVAALAVVLLCVGFIYIADQKSSSELQQVVSQNESLKTTIDTLKSKTQQVNQIEEHQQELRELLDTIATEKRRDGKVRQSFDSIASLFATNPQSRTQKSMFETHGWNEAWSIQRTAPFSLNFDGSSWILKGATNTPEDLQEIARRQQPENTFHNDGLDQLTARAPENPSEKQKHVFNFTWIAPLQLAIGDE